MNYRNYLCGVTKGKISWIILMQGIFIILYLLYKVTYLYIYTYIIYIPI